VVGSDVSAAALRAMPWLGITKRRVAAHLERGAWRGGAASTVTGGYGAATVLVGLVLDARLHRWWAAPTMRTLIGGGGRRTSPRSSSSSG
jgi:hypothetical protein